LQGKGGVGKTLIASLLLQYCQHTGREVVGYDADPVNVTLSSVKGLAAQPIKLVEGENLVVATADQFVEDLLTCPTDVVLDNGAAGFLAVSNLSGRKSDCRAAARGRPGFGDPCRGGRRTGVPGLPERPGRAGAELPGNRPVRGLDE
jgi:hypothetical protein